MDDHFKRRERGGGAQWQEEPQKFTVLDTCASLQVYANLMIDGFAGMPAKLARMITYVT